MVLLSHRGNALLDAVQPDMTHGPKSHPGMAPTAVQPIHLLLLFGFLLRSSLSETFEKPFRQRKVGTCAAANLESVPKALNRLFWAMSFEPEALAA